MKISFSWLKEYINIKADPEHIARVLTDVGLEVSGIEIFESVIGSLEGLVIGEVLSCEKHPNADKLTVCDVNVGSEQQLKIVCGAPNVAEGQKVVVATVGTYLYPDNQKKFQIKQTKIRGVDSFGMICSEKEIGVGDSHEGIMVLNSNAVVGTPASGYFNIEKDIVYSVELTPNRIDGASHYGVARDIAAFYNQFESVKLNKPSINDFKIDNSSLVIDVEIKNSPACPRYSGITISGIEVRQSPMWLQNRLKSIGIKPINNIVDCTNYVLHELGHPLHAFDADKIEGNKIVVDNLPNGTNFITLDNIERKLSENDLMICDISKGLCIAGVFGGIDSGITENTKNIFIESACFNSVTVRKTARLHGLNTDASFRFERGVDPNATVDVLKRVAMLIKKTAGGQISSPVIDVYPEVIYNQTVELLFSNVDRLIGNEIEKEQIKKILQSLDIKVIAEKEIGLLLEIPSYRVDVTREVDVIEEILRIYGYNNINISSTVRSSVQYSEKPDKEKIINNISDMLVGLGFNEIMSNSLTKSRYYDNLIKYPPKNTARIFNPLSLDLNGLRQTLLFGGLEAISYNTNRKNSSLRIFEFGNCYYYNKKDNISYVQNYSEETHLALFITGMKNEKGWNQSPSISNFYTLKAQVNNILERSGIKNREISENIIQNEIFDNGLDFKHNETIISELGIINKNLLNQFDLSEPVYYAEIYWEKILNIVKEAEIKFHKLPKYPEVRRDLSLLIDKNIKYYDLKIAAFQTEQNILKDVIMFDVFENEKIGLDKKSYAIGFVLQDNNKTLTDKQIDNTMDRLIQMYRDKFGAQLR
ncbi:MAG: phenylalanine--tRNA ligase subunit beta [Bacteroidota bacterium]